jgi:hypothetical protein
MRRISLLMLLSLMITGSLMAQRDTLRGAPSISHRPIRTIRTPTPTIKPKNQHLVSLFVHAPVGVFSKSHIAGFGLNYNLVSRHYVKLWQKRYLNFTAIGGIDYFLGKKTEVAGHDFTYEGYTYLYLHAGIMTQFIRKSGILLSAGPSTGLYKGNTDFGWSAAMSANIVLSERIVIGPAVTYRKHKETDALWALAVRTAYRF